MDMLNRILNKIKLRYYDIDTWKYLLTLLKLEYQEHFIEDKGFLYLSKLNLKVSKNNFIFLLRAYENALELVECVDGLFTIEDNQLYITVENLKFEVQTAEELFILKEIFVEGIYNFNLSDDVKNYLLIDIGMNVAYASCYFAKIKQISYIISFEPFTPTYNQAKQNIKLNNLKNKIEIHNYGFGRCDEILEVSYTPEYRGQVGIQGTEYIRSEIRESHNEKIVIKDAFEPLDNIENNFPLKRFIMKIDCEGAEYDFINRIPISILSRCDLIMMEWHEKGPKDIEEWLSMHGFIQMSFYPHSKRTGMIYAIKHI